jgi:hypothetical protein
VSCPLYSSVFDTEENATLPVTIEVIIYCSYTL